MIKVYFVNGETVDFDGTMQEMKNILEDQLKKCGRANPFIILNGVLINIEKITHIVEVAENEN